MTSVAMAQANYNADTRRTTLASETTTTTNMNGNASPTESTMTSAYMVRVVALGNTYDIPVTPHTRVSSVLREVAELAITYEQSLALGDVHAALCHGDVVLPVDGPIGLLSQNAMLRLLTNYDPGFDTIEESLTATLMSFHSVQHQQQVQQQQIQQQKLPRQASMRTAASLHGGLRHVGSRSGLMTVPETSLILSPYNASLTPASMVYPHTVVLSPQHPMAPYVIGQPAGRYVNGYMGGGGGSSHSINQLAGRSVVVSPPAPYLTNGTPIPMPVVNGILATGTNAAGGGTSNVNNGGTTAWGMTEGGPVYRVPIRSADELLLPADIAERQRRATTTSTLNNNNNANSYYYNAAGGGRSRSAGQDRLAATQPSSTPFVPLDPNGIKPKNKASGTSFRSIISLVSRPFSFGRRSSSSPQTGSVHTNLTEEERRENSNNNNNNNNNAAAEQQQKYSPQPGYYAYSQAANGPGADREGGLQQQQQMSAYPTEDQQYYTTNNNNNTYRPGGHGGEEDVEVEEQEGSFEHEPRSFTRPPVDRRATLDEMQENAELGATTTDTLPSPHSAPAVDTTNTKAEDSALPDQEHQAEEEEEQYVHEGGEGEGDGGAAPVPVRRVSKSMTDTSQSHTLPSDHVISFNTTTLPSLPKTDMAELSEPPAKPSSPEHRKKEEEEEKANEVATRTTTERRSSQTASKTHSALGGTNTTTDTLPSPIVATTTTTAAAVRRRRSSPTATGTAVSSRASSGSRTHVVSTTQRMSERSGSSPAAGSAIAAVAKKKRKSPPPILHSIEISHPRKHGHSSTAAHHSSISSNNKKTPTALRESIRDASYMTIRDKGQTPTESVLQPHTQQQAAAAAYKQEDVPRHTTATTAAQHHNNNKDNKKEEAEGDAEERVRTPKPAHRKNSAVARLRHSKDVSPNREELMGTAEQQEKAAAAGEEEEVKKAAEGRRQTAGGSIASHSSGSILSAHRDRAHHPPSLPPLSPKSLKEVNGQVDEATSTSPDGVLPSLPAAQRKPTTPEKAAAHAANPRHTSAIAAKTTTATASAVNGSDNNKKKTTSSSKKISPKQAGSGGDGSGSGAEEVTPPSLPSPSTGRRPRRTPRSPQAATITAVGDDTAANYTGTSPAEDHHPLLSYTPAPALAMPSAPHQTIAPPVTAGMAHTALPNGKASAVAKAKRSATAEAGADGAARKNEATAETQTAHGHLSAHARRGDEEEAAGTHHTRDKSNSPPQPKSILMISSLPRYTHQITFNNRGGRRKSSLPSSGSLVSPPSALPTPHSPNGHAASLTKTPPSSSERNSSNYTVESFDTEGKDFIRITLRDPVDPSIFHFSVPVDRQCPVGALRSWLTDEIASRAKVDGRPVPAFGDVKKYALYCGDTRLVDDSRLTFEDATRGKHDCIFSIRLMN